jgi:hypothetical protein
LRIGYHAVSQRPQRPKEQDRAAAFKALIDRLQAWDIPNDAVDRVHEAARTSLAEVKALTEYEDGKVSRLLTVVAFLSAVVGAVFTRFASDYAWPKMGDAHFGADWLLPIATYTAFFAYAIVVTASVLTLLGAIKPTFNIPATWKGAGHSGLPSSMLFYARILDVPAPQWGEAFQRLTEKDKNGTELKQYYAKCYIAEAYLVAEKVADKLQVVDPGIGALRWAMGVLLGFFILFAATIVAVQPDKSISSPAPLPEVHAPAPPPAAK